MRGIVQGVGFRPTVARLASQFDITGLVGNDDASVFIEIQGADAAISAFWAKLDGGLPPLARVDSIESRVLPVINNEIGFRIVTSRRSGNSPTLISPDVAPCVDCLRELADPTNRRFGYPFISCTNCGPRLSIICDLPYDRPLTTLAKFELCPACAAEYADPTDRRYHAQPISCYDCGPGLWLAEATVDLRSGAEVEGGLASPPNPVLAGRELERSVVETQTGLARRREWAALFDQARELLREGAIVAVKGVGGFHLVCDARNAAAVARLRTRKHRPHKPFAVMVASVAAAQQLVDLTPDQVVTLSSWQRPIVLAPQIPVVPAEFTVISDVAPGLDQLGVMLPSSPLHALLITDDMVCVATSGNISGEPLAYDNAEAFDRLGRIADYFLYHNRPIQVPVEDSVVMALGNTTGDVGAVPDPVDSSAALTSVNQPISPSATGLRQSGTVAPIRRSRGFAPLPIQLGSADVSVLAVGAELKNTFAVTRDGRAFISAHIGDMAALVSQQAFARSVEQMTAMHRRQPDIIVADRHPDYAATAWAQRRADQIDRPLLQIQHHHAHALSLVAEYQATKQRAVVATLDGTGYGDDATIWGGEIIALGANPLEYDRAWHLPGFWLAGGDSAIMRPWKQAVALLREYDLDSDQLDFVRAADPVELRLVRSQLRSQVGCVWTTSAGRLFDAVAGLLGICPVQTYEGQAGAELERAARDCQHNHDQLSATIPELIGNIVHGLVRKRPRPCLARIFHQALAALVAEALTQAAAGHGSQWIGLSGGVTQNQLLTEALAAALRGLRTHQRVPANDGGISLGQALAGYLQLTTMTKVSS